VDVIKDDSRRVIVEQSTVYQLITYDDDRTTDKNNQFIVDIFESE
jgi:hypothetical protein